MKQETLGAVVQDKTIFRGRIQKDGDAPKKKMDLRNRIPKERVEETELSERIRYLGEPLFQTELFKEGEQQKHHRTTLMGHTLQVAANAERIALMFLRYGIEVNVNDVVIAALCHDIGMVGRARKYRNNYECCKKHPADSVAEARKIYPNLSKKAEDAILHHMWPINRHAPKSPEAWTVLLSDKLCSIGGVVTRKG